MTKCDAMGRAVFTLWTALAVALCSAVCGNAATEWLADSSLLGAGPHDGHQESLLPTAFCALIVTAGLAVALLLRPHAPRPRSAFVFPIAGVLAAVAVVLMEGYEVGFGGVAPFDPGSVLVAHAPFVLVAYAVIGAAIDRLVNACMRVVRDIAPALAALVLAQRSRDRGVPGSTLIAARRFRGVVFHPTFSRKIRGFRAPPGGEFHHSPLTRRISWSYAFRGP